MPPTLEAKAIPMTRDLANGVVTSIVLAVTAKAKGRRLLTYHHPFIHLSTEAD
jgi:hypothetical protein